MSPSTTNTLEQFLSAVALWPSEARGRLCRWVVWETLNALTAEPNPFRGEVVARGVEIEESAASEGGTLVRVTFLASAEQVEGQRPPEELVRQLNGLGQIIWRIAFHRAASPATEQAARTRWKTAVESRNRGLWNDRLAGAGDDMRELCAALCGLDPHAAQNAEEGAGENLESLLRRLRKQNGKPAPLVLGETKSSVPWKKLVWVPVLVLVIAGGFFGLRPSGGRETLPQHSEAGGNGPSPQAATNPVTRPLSTPRLDVAKLTSDLRNASQYLKQIGAEDISRATNDLAIARSLLVAWETNALLSLPENRASAQEVQTLKGAIASSSKDIQKRQGSLTEFQTKAREIARSAMKLESEVISASNLLRAAWTEVSGLDQSLGTNDWYGAFRAINRDRATIEGMADQARKRAADLAGLKQELEQILSALGSATNALGLVEVGQWRKRAEEIRLKADSLKEPKLSLQAKSLGVELSKREEWEKRLASANATLNQLIRSSANAGAGALPEMRSQVETLLRDWPSEPELQVKGKELLEKFRSRSMNDEAKRARIVDAREKATAKLLKADTALQLFKSTFDASSWLEVSNKIAEIERQVPSAFDSEIEAEFRPKVGKLKDDINEMKGKSELVKRSQRQEALISRLTASLPQDEMGLVKCQEEWGRLYTNIDLRDRKLVVTTYSAQTNQASRQLAALWEVQRRELQQSVTDLMKIFGEVDSNSVAQKVLAKPFNDRLDALSKHRFAGEHTDYFKTLHGARSAAAQLNAISSNLGNSDANSLYRLWQETVLIHNKLPTPGMPRMTNWAYALYSAKTTSKSTQELALIEQLPSLPFVRLSLPNSEQLGAQETFWVSKRPLTHDDLKALGMGTQGERFLNANARADMELINDGLLRRCQLDPKFRDSWEVSLPLSSWFRRLRSNEALIHQLDASKDSATHGELVRYGGGFARLSLALLAEDLNAPLKWNPGNDNPNVFVPVRLWLKPVVK